MMIAARNAFLMGGAKLPYDAEVEYLKRARSARAYIDTGVPLYHTGKWEITIQSPSATGQERFMGGASSADGSDFWNMIAFGNTGTNMYPYTYGGYNWADANVSTVNTRNKNLLVFEFQPRSQKLYVNGVLHKQSTNNAATISNSKNIWIFLANENGSLSYNRREIYIYHVAMYVDSNLVRDFTPVRIGSVGYLYDRANPSGGPLGNGLYGNAGTGAFVIGPDK